MNKETIKLNVICAIYNIINIICFITLSVIFNKWWIALFSALFMSYVKEVGGSK